MMNFNPEKPTEVFLILHEKAYRPEGSEYEYMTGKLRAELESNSFGKILTPSGQARAKKLGKQFKSVGLSFLVTDDFITSRETARLIAEEGGNGEPISVRIDRRISESDLSYLTPAKFKVLGKAEASGDPNAALRDWMSNCPNNFEQLVNGHVALWNELLSVGSGERFSIVLHIEGFLLYCALALGCSPERLTSLHVPRAHPVHIRLFPGHSPIVSFGDEAYWRNQGDKSIFGQY